MHILFIDSEYITIHGKMNEDLNENDLICKKCNSEYKVKNDNKDNDCTPEKCSVYETCERCNRDINCHRENLHILTKIDNSNDDLTYCGYCCSARDEEILNEGWKCDECDYNSEVDEDHDEDK